MLVLFIGAGLFFTVKMKGTQFNLAKIFRETLFRKPDSEASGMKPFKTLTSTLAVTLGTGNIVALGTAIALGGAGAVFWMWVSAFLGMATTYAENFFGMKYRKKLPDGTYSGGAFYYIEKALGGSWAKLFAFSCIMASLGMGNMTQTNALSTAMYASFETPAWLSGLMAAVLVGFMVFGGAMLLGDVTEKVIPVIGVVYIVGCLAVIGINWQLIPEVFLRIVREAFGLRAVGGGVVGSVLLSGMSWGFRRGVFSNEAGLGTTVMLNTLSSEKSAERQGMWAMLTVFFDTIVMCTLTALAILLTGADRAGGEGTGLAAAAFSSAFGAYADAFVTICIAIFAIATVSGWSVFGSVCVRYLFGERLVKPFMLVFIGCCFVGAVINLEIAWAVADAFNGVMAVPNLLSVLALGVASKLQD